MIVKLKRYLLRIEKNFGLNINEPLKKAMINKSTPNFPMIILFTRRHKREILTAYQSWSKKIEAVCTIVKCEYYWQDIPGIDILIMEQQQKAGAKHQNLMRRSMICWVERSVGITGKIRGSTS